MLASFRQRYLPVEHRPHDCVKGALGDEVVNVDRGRLSDAVSTVFRLLHVSRVPVELGKHHMAGSGEGQTLDTTHTYTHRKAA